MRFQIHSYKFGTIILTVALLIVIVSFLFINHLVRQLSNEEQKRIELWGEGVVFYDFKRLGLGINNGYSGTNVPTDSRVNVKGVAPWWNFCIPEEETYQNAALDGKNNPNPDGLIKLWTETE